MNLTQPYMVSVSPDARILAVSVMRTSADWDMIRKFYYDNLTIHLSQSRKIRFYVISICMGISSVLYFINLVKTALERKFWLFRTDKDGYWCPNIHTLVPLLSTVINLLLLTSILMLVGDEHPTLSLPIILAQLFSYHFLFFCGVSHTWTILAALPATTYNLGTDLRSHVLAMSARAFNSFICLIYLSFPLVSLPLHLYMAVNTLNLQALWRDYVLPSLDGVIKDIGSMDHREGLSSNLQHLEDKLKRATLLWRVTYGIYSIYVLIHLGLFCYASVKLLKALTNQLKIIQNARDHVQRLVTINATGKPHQFGMKGRSSTSSSKKTLLARLLTWLDITSDTENRIWGAVKTDGVVDEIKELSDRHGTVNRYRKAVGIQLAMCVVVIVPFLALMVCLTSNAFGIPKRTTAIDVVWITYEWGGWMWGPPSVGLSIIACCITFVSSLNGRVKSNSLPEASRRSTPTLSGSRVTSANLSDKVVTIHASDLKLDSAQSPTKSNFSRFESSLNQFLFSHTSRHRNESVTAVPALNDELSDGSDGDGPIMGNMNKSLRTRKNHILDISRDVDVIRSLRTQPSDLDQLETSDETDGSNIDPERKIARMT